MLTIDLKGRRALVAGVADDEGFGFAIAKALAEAGATVCLGTWPPFLGIFNRRLRTGFIDEARKMNDGSLLEFERIYPFDAAYDTLDAVPPEVMDNKRYRGLGDFSIAGVAKQLVTDFGERPIDIVVHSLANGPEVKKPLIETSREGYLNALSVSAYSFVSTVARFAPIMRPGGSFLSLSHMAAERVIPAYGGGMSSAKAALESDTRTLAYEAGRIIRDFPRMSHTALDAALSAEAAGIATECGLRGADAVYVATARRAGSTLVTLDRELRERAGGVVRVETPDEWLRRSA